MKYADLHVHTVYSDGTFTPEGLIAAARREGVDAVAVVDHDTLDAIAPAHRAARGSGVEIIPGIELSAELERGEVHILGYFLDCGNKPLLDQLSILKTNRVERIYRMTEKLESLGVHLDPRDVFALSKTGTVGRLHVALAMVKAGVVATISEAFQRYIGDRGPAHVLGFKLSPAAAVGLIKGAGGIPVLAHPYSLHDDSLIPGLIGQGIMGLEVHYPEHSQSMTNYYLNIARSSGILATGGSDCHGTAKPDVRIGAVKVGYDVVDEMKRLCGRL